MGLEIEERFQFGENWSRFLRVLDEGRIAEARKSVQQMLDLDNLRGQRFLDAGSGSGLFSLAAYQLGARVHSFDFDPESVACTRELRRRYADRAAEWSIEEGSILDPEYLRNLGEFDTVYCWGVLHHTGAMWEALENLTMLVKRDGQLYVSIYNDQGARSRLWARVKRLYNRLPAMMRTPYVVLVMAPFELGGLLLSLARLRPDRYVARWRSYRRSRGMSRWHDLVDWVGGYPFEVAQPADVVELCRARGFDLVRLVAVGRGWGCNEFVFRRG